MSNSGPPTMMMVPGIEQYRNRYFFYVHQDASNAYIILIVDQQKTAGMYLEQKLATFSQLWTTVPGTVSPLYQTNSIRLSVGTTHTLQHVDGSTKFGAYLYQDFNSGTCSALQSVGYCLHTLSNVSIIYNTCVCVCVITLNRCLCRNIVIFLQVESVACQ